ncbi:hypothetical protein ABZ341_24335, partial [Streptomyces sp. NPDC006173]|uniref:hypothetical protein n=1 Tax=Streptomyces sp. NPDC006173 TaxID=3155349 RepID=UPI0034026721
MIPSQRHGDHSHTNTQTRPDNNRPTRHGDDTATRSEQLHAASEGTPAVRLQRPQRLLIGVVVAGAVVIAGIGFAGSYAAVRELAIKK